MKLYRPKHAQPKYIRGFLNAPYIFLRHHPKILKYLPDFRDTSLDTPNTHNSFVFESRLNFMNKFTPEMHLRKVFENIFLKPTRKKQGHLLYYFQG